MKQWFHFLFLTIFLCKANISCSQEPSQAPVQVKIVQEPSFIKPQEPFWVAFEFQIEEGWHLYWKNPGQVGMPISIKWQLPEGFSASALKWPYPERFETSELTGFGYAKEVKLLAQIMPPAHLEKDSSFELGAQVDWLVCSSTACQPDRAHLSLKVNSQFPFAEKKEQWQTSLQEFEKARQKIPCNDLGAVAKRSHGLIELQIPSDNQEMIQAQFFPEKQGELEDRISAQLAFSKDLPQTYLLQLKEITPLTTLKGVLVLEIKGGEKKAFEINCPIQGETDALSRVATAETIARPREKQQGEKQQGENGDAEFAGGLGLALALAFLGGLILNFMPCVLPIISLKIMSFVKMAGQKRSLTFKHGLWFSLGVLLSFWLLVAAIFILRSYGEVVGWGFQLQEPAFVVGLICLFFLFALSLFGIFEWGLIFSSWAGQAQVNSASQTKESFANSFFSGILATAVATPCTGPFLGSALGYALTLPALQALMVFTFLALGMCAPYLLLSAFPALLKFVPRPGPWMETFKQLTGFILLAAVVWLMWVFSAQTNSFSLICLITGLLCFSIGAWIYGRGGVPSVSKLKRVSAYALTLLALFIGVEVILLPRASWQAETSSSNSSSDWEEFSLERVAQLKALGQPFLIDFTAKWCLICQVNHLVLSSSEVQAKLDQLGVVKMKADWTKNDPMITKELSKFGRNSVPLYVIYGQNSEKEPTILPQVLTPEIVTSHLENAVGKIIKRNS